MKLKRRRCPVCQSGDGETLYSCEFEKLIPFLQRSYGDRDFSVLAGELYSVRRCDCQMIYQEMIPDDEMAAVLYNEWIDPEKTRKTHMQASLDQRLSLVRDVAAVVNYFGRQPSMLRVLDFGMGWAEWCLAARGLSCHVMGSELSKERVDHAAALGIHVAGLSEIRGCCDFINTEQVFEHLTEPLETLRHLKSGLRAGGLIRISVPNGRSLGDFWQLDWSALPPNGGQFNPIFPLEHLNTFTHQTLVSLAERAGLRRVELPVRVWLRNFVKAEPMRQTVEWLLRLTPYARNRSTILYFAK